MTDVALYQLRYLEAEFARIDVLLRREVRKWVLAGQDPNDDYRGMYVAKDEAEALLDRPFGVSWGQWIELPAEEEAGLERLAAQAETAIRKAEQAITKQGAEPRLLQLATAFGLDRTALDILLLCLAPAFDTKYERLYGYLQDNVTRRRPSVRLILDLLGEPGVEKLTLAARLQEEAPLFRQALLSFVVESPPANAHWLNQTLQPSETVVAWLRGYYEPTEALVDQVELHAYVLQKKKMSDHLEYEEMERSFPWLRHIPSPKGVDGPIVVMHGTDVEHQRAIATTIAKRLKRPLLTAHLDKIITDDCPALTALRLILRDAQLTGSLPLFLGWDRCLDDDQLEPNMMATLCQHAGMIIIAGTKHWLPSGIEQRRPFVTIATQLPNVDRRLTCWQQQLMAQLHCDKSKQSSTLANYPLADLAGQFILSRGQIRDAVLAARDRAWQAEREMMGDDLYQAARQFSNPRLNTLARKIEARYGKSDLVLPDDEITKLEELIVTVRQRRRVLEQHPKLAPSTGIMTLFAGPPGTGKTMAAEVVAAELKLDLYKIDLSGVVSKYIGETEKNLERIFTEAENSNSILFFDEADAIFGKRGEAKDAHDRYANLEVAYLLQRMELYDGVTVLATNLRSNLDEAFARRFFRTVDFPFPKREERRRIWETIFAQGVERSADIDTKLLADRFELAGGNIRNIVYSASIQAIENGGVVTMSYLLHGARRELQKMGRLVHEEDFQQ